jgi:hypothetical protein
MGYSITAKSLASGFTGSTSVLYGAIGGGGGALSATETQTQHLLAYPTGSDGTFSNLTCCINNVGTGRVLRFRVDGGNASQVVNIPDTTAGVFTDNTHGDFIVANPDEVDWSFIQSTGAATLYWVACTFLSPIGPGSEHTSFLIAQNGTGRTIGASATQYPPMAGDLLGPSIESAGQCSMRVGGTVGDYNVAVSANSRSDSTTICLRKNGVDGASGNSLVLPAGLTGYFAPAGIDTVFNAGDALNHRITTGAGTGTITVVLMGCTLDNGSGVYANDIFGFGDNGGALFRAASATNNYYAFLGNTTSGITTEDQTTSIVHPFACLTSNFRLNVQANTYTGSATCQMRRNRSVNCNQTFAIGAGLTGLFEDATHSDFLSPGDDIAWYMTGGTAGSITLRAVGLTQTNLTVSAGSFAETGGAATFQARMAAAAGSFALSGQASGLEGEVAGCGAFAFTGFPSLYSYDLLGGGGTIAAGTFSRGRWRALQEQLAADAAAERKARQESKRRRRELAQAAAAAERERARAARARTAAANAAAASRRALSDALVVADDVRRARELMRRTGALHALATAVKARQHSADEDEDEALALLLAA